MKVQLKFHESGGELFRFYFTVREPGKVPRVKTPPDQSRNGVETFARELVDAFPDADIQLLQLRWTGELWASCAREFLLMLDAARIIADGVADLPVNIYNKQES